MPEGKTGNFCVIGDPIGHSLSPLIHNFIFKSLGLDLSYDAVRVFPAGLRRFVEESRQSERPGFNVTIPHKQAVIPFLDRLDATAERIGAVNTVHRTGRQLSGFNTDVHGCRTALIRSDWKRGNGAVVLLGAGGAARAVAEALDSLGVSKLHLYEIDIPRMERFVSDFKSAVGMEITPLTSDSDLADSMKDSELLINATPVGMWPKVDQSPIPHADWITPSSWVFDMVPNPVETMLLRQAKSRGADTISGLVMLVAQAIAADELWLGRKLPESLHADVFTHCMKFMEAHGSASDSHGR
jgi:shikimate dehydrogenase